MGEKKTPYRFTIGFSAGDPAHRQAAEILNGQGRRKAQFLVNAILHYIHCPETPDLSEGGVISSGAMERETVEEVVLRVLERRGYLAPAAPEPASDLTAGPERTLGAADMAAIADSLAEFRRI